MKTKICTKCRKRLSVKKFQLNRNTKDGLQCHCKDCRRKYISRGGKGYKVFREYQNSYQNNYYHKHKENIEYKEKLKKYRKEFEKKHPNYYKKYNKNEIYYFIYIFI